MKTILVLNTKGGSGKTTVATNIASLYAAGGVQCAIMDYDQQASSLHWRSLRDEERPDIHVVDARKTKLKQTRTWQLKLPSETERVIIDAPAGAEGLMLQEMIRRTHMIVIPVAPSPIDIHATSDFIKDLLLIGKIRKFGIRVAVIANRVRRHTPTYEPLQNFLSNLNIPFVTTLSDTDNYIIAAEQGIGIHEMDEDETRLEREQWYPLARWLALDGDEAALRDHADRPGSNVHPISLVAR
jgi:chromosome partitioning protein